MSDLSRFKCFHNNKVVLVRARVHLQLSDVDQGAEDEEMLESNGNIYILYQQSTSKIPAGIQKTKAIFF